MVASMGKNYKKLLITMLLIVAMLVAACGRILHNPAMVKVDPYYITGSRENKEQLQDLFALLYNKNNSDENTFAVVREIANNYAKTGEYGRLIHFLSDRKNNNPDDPYNTYYLLMIAYAHIQQDSMPVAARYFDLIVKNYADLSINGESIHLACLNQLIHLVNNHEQLVWYYQELISRFSDQIDLGAAWFMLGQAYEHTGDWNSAIQAYIRYLPHSGTVIYGFPNAYDYARQQVDFHNSPKNWTYESLPALLTAIRGALDTGNVNQLRRIQARVNFFTRSWGQWELDDTRISDFNLSNFMQGNHIRYADTLDISSNSTGALLRTWGWSQYISTWYLYFRRIYFPSDPNVHGRWEWVGVYFGEKQN
jgi:tetratricopeptide (TPR) repeat protein